MRPWRVHATVGCLLLFTLSGSGAHAFRVADLNAYGPSGYARWDAAARSVPTFDQTCLGFIGVVPGIDGPEDCIDGGVERSLDGGLEYSMSGGSYSAFQSQFTWSETAPTSSEFEDAVKRSFDAWTAVDPATGLGAGFSFTEDFSTNVQQDTPFNVFDIAEYSGINPGAEIDLIANNDAADFDPGDPNMRGNTIFFVDDWTFDDITLTSGTTGYGGGAITGADIVLNTDAVWTLDVFELILTHEIGHALGLSDVEHNVPDPLNVNTDYFDDDYDVLDTPAEQVASLNNSFALLIDPDDPDASPLLSIFQPSVGAPGVDILMETNIPLAFLGVTNPLQNDDYAARQFLYPVLLPEPTTSGLLALGLLGFAVRGRGPRRAG